ncbi:MAG: ATP-binding cassette domain-containing protein [Candidatus Cloacimonetes bacterium]|nr:ATP-binding cassette domain-containing protein [Candidatus Cloacimonadota bacterium]
MSLISTSKPISHNFGDQDIFKNISFAIEQDSKIGLIGRNGSGKSTLFNLLIKKITPHNGDIQMVKNCKIAYLTQDPELNNEMLLYETVSLSRPDFVELESKLSQATENLEKDNSPENYEKYVEIQQRFEEIDGYHYETEIKLVLTSLNFPKETWNQKIALFSGGEKTRIQLAKFLLSPFDLLLLDEPTNHLDLKMIYWLENYLSKLNKPYIIVSHDRQFLDRTVTKIYEISNCKITKYKGNYSAFEKEKVERETLLVKEYDNQQKKIKKIKEQIKQYRIWGNARDSEVMFKRAKELEKRLTKVEIIDKPRNEKEINLRIAINKRSGNDVFHLEDISFGFSKNVLASKVNLRIGYQDRIAVLGDNGCGKTTLLKLLYNEVNQLSGTIKKGASLNIAYYDQMHIKLVDNLSIMKTIWELAPLATQGYVLSYLAKFGFRGDDVDKLVSTLSGGEKARLYLAKLIHDKPNFLILDEPTNHLDILMIKSLENALINFEGTIIFVSHDRHFINKVASKKWFFKDKTVIETDDSLESLFFSKTAKPKPKKALVHKEKTKKVNPYLVDKLYQEIEDLNKKLQSKKDVYKVLEEKFADSTIYSNEKELTLTRENIKLLTQEIDDLSIELDEKENTYLEYLEE